MRIPLLKEEDGSLALEVPDDLLQQLTSLISSPAEVHLKENQDKDAELEGNKSLVDKVAAWLDTQVIAEMVVDHLKAQGLPVTFEKAKEVWLDTLQMLGGHLAELKEKLAEGDGRTMDDFTPIEKATFVLTWGAGLSPEEKATFARAVGITGAGEAKVAEAEAEVAEETPLIINGKTDRPGYKYFPHIDTSIRE